MNNTPFDTRSSEWIGDLTVWERENGEDNAVRLERLRRNLRKVREKELTPCQKQVLELYYDRHLSVTQIARRLDVNPSTVSRTLKRAEKRLRRYLQYAL